MNRKQLSVLLETARRRITMASDVIEESRRRATRLPAAGIRVAVIPDERRPPMADDLGNRGRPDRDRINVNEDYEVRDWAKKLGVSPDELKRAVQQVGDRADAVRQHLGK